MTEQDQTPRPDDDAMGHKFARDADDARGDDDDTTGHKFARDADDARGDDDDDTMGHIRTR